MEAPVINVGIMTHKAISFVFNEEYVHTETDRRINASREH